MARLFAIACCTSSCPRLSLLLPPPRTTLTMHVPTGPAISPIAAPTSTWQIRAYSP